MGYRPFSCDLCAKTFQYRNSWRKHRKTCVRSEVESDTKGCGGIQCFQCWFSQQTCNWWGSQWKLSNSYTSQDCDVKPSVLLLDSKFLGPSPQTLHQCKQCSFKTSFRSNLSLPIHCMHQAVRLSHMQEELPHQVWSRFAQIVRGRKHGASLRIVL